jgi:lactate dehydrogenase-like 2-hydroxyacid dehydrogenase
MTPERPFVIVTRALPRAVEEALATEFRVRLNPEDRQFSPGELSTALAEADAVLCTITDPLTPGVLATRPCRTRILANFGVGVNHIDLGAAAVAGLVVTNTPGVLTECTADLTIALLLMVLRRLGEGERELRAGRWTGWRPTHLLGQRVSGRTLGLVGFGRIGRAVGRRARLGFGMRVLATGPTAPPPDTLEGAGVEWKPTLGALLAEADIVSLHCPLEAATRGLIGRDALGTMRPGSVLLNTARGGLVDEAALVEALRTGHLAGAGLDVFEGEPTVLPALTGLENVVLLPHLGSATMETRVAMGMRALENLRAWARGERPPDLV